MLPLALGYWVFGLGILGMMALALWVVGLVDIARRPDLDRSKRWTWILLVVLLPIAGTIIYLVSRPTLPEERQKIIEAQARRH